MRVYLSIRPHQSANVLCFVKVLIQSNLTHTFNVHIRSFGVERFSPSINRKEHNEHK